MIVKIKKLRDNAVIPVKAHPSDAGFDLVAATDFELDEDGNVANKFKKVKRDDHKVITEKRRMDLAHELGDVLWYVAMGAKELGFTLEEIAQMNYDKLHSRAERGKISGEGDER